MVATWVLQTAGAMVAATALAYTVVKDAYNAFKERRAAAPKDAQGGVLGGGTDVERHLAIVLAKNQEALEVALSGSTLSSSAQSALAEVLRANSEAVRALGTFRQERDESQIRKLAAFCAVERRHSSQYFNEFLSRSAQGLCLSQEHVHPREVLVLRPDAGVKGRYALRAVKELELVVGNLEEDERNLFLSLFLAQLDSQDSNVKDAIRTMSSAGIVMVEESVGQESGATNQGDGSPREDAPDDVRGNVRRSQAPVAGENQEGRVRQ